MVAANRELIARFEKKIHATLARVWGEDVPAAEATKTANHSIDAPSKQKMKIPASQRVILPQTKHYAAPSQAVI